MRKVLMAALGLGAAYLWRNKDARDKVMNQIQTLTGKMKQQQP